MVKVQKPTPKTLEDSSQKMKSKIKKSITKGSKTTQQSIKETIKSDEKTAKPVINQSKDKTSKKALPTKKTTDVKNEKKAAIKKNTKLPQNTTVTKAKVNPKKLEQEKKTLKLTQKKPVPEVKSTKNSKETTVDKATKKRATIKAYNNKQKKNRSAATESDEIVKPHSSKTQFESVPFDEDKLKAIVNNKSVNDIVGALKTLVEKEVTEKKTSIFSDYRYFLNVCSYKIANCPKRMVKLNLKHSLVDTTTDDVAIIVPDLQRGAKVDYEPTIQHYEDLLREIGVNNLKIIPFNQLRKECTTFESKRKFANTYDYFLCDGRIVSHVVGFCGKHFQKPRTVVHAVRLDNPKTYKSDIEHALKRTAFKQIEKGDLVSIPVANDRFTVDQVADNILLVVEQLKSLHPGGYANIRNMNVKIDIKGTSSLPLYANLSGAPSETPNVVGTREQRMLKLKKDANDILSKFSLSKSGEFIKLNKAQVQRKEVIKEKRKALLSEENAETPKDNDNSPPSKKVRKLESEKEFKKLDKSVENEEAEDSEGGETEEDCEQEEDSNDEGDSSNNNEEEDDDDNSVDDSE